jgi:hypothetical protein
MSGKNKIGGKSRSDHHSYLKGEMSDRERNAFERELEADPFEREAAEGLSSLTGDELNNDLTKLSQRLDSRISKPRFTIWYRLSAAAVAILVVTSLFLVRELKRPGVVLSDNQGVVVDQSEIEQITEPVKEINEISRSGQPEVDRRISDAVEGQNIPAEVTIPQKIGEEELSQTQKVSAGERAQNEKVARAAMSDTYLADTLPVYDLQGKVVEVSPMARPSAKASSKKADLLSEYTVGSVLQRKVSGIVVSSDDNLPIPGAVITLKGTSTGVTSDYSGYFEIDADSNQVLIADFIGMKREEVDISTTENLRITLKPDLLSLDEVIVMGYASESRNKTTRTISVTEIDLSEEDVEYTVPIPDGGMANLREYIQENLVFPESYIDSDREVVRIKFTVKPGIAPYDFEIIRSPGEEFSKEAVRLIKEGPLWDPAIRNGMPVTDSVSLRIVFKRR